MLEILVLSVSLLAAVVGATGGYLWWRAANVGELRRSAIILRNTLDECISDGGFYSTRFEEEDLRLSEQQLADVQERLNDRKLRQLAGQALAAYRRVVETAPPPAYVIIIGDVPDPADQARWDQLARQVEEARTARATLAPLLQRANKLERFLIRRG